MQIALSSPHHAALVIEAGGMMPLLSLMTHGEEWAERAAGGTLISLLTEIKHALDEGDQVGVG